MVTFSVAAREAIATVEWDGDHYAPDVVADMVAHTVKAAVLAVRLDAEVESDG